jgi:hypothetical protein
MFDCIVFLHRVSLHCLTSAGDTTAGDTSMCCAGQVACVVEEGQPTSEHSWFDGYAWQLSYCERCAFGLCSSAAHPVNSMRHLGTHRLSLVTAVWPLWTEHGSTLQVSAACGLALFSGAG